MDALFEPFDPEAEELAVQQEGTAGNKVVGQELQGDESDEITSTEDAMEEGSAKPGSPLVTGVSPTKVVEIAKDEAPAPLVPKRPPPPPPPQFSGQLTAPGGLESARAMVPKDLSAPKSWTEPQPAAIPSTVPAVHVQSPPKLAAMKPFAAVCAWEAARKAAPKPPMAMPPPPASLVSKASQAVHMQGVTVKAGVQAAKPPPPPRQPAHASIMNSAAMVPEVPHQPPQLGVSVEFSGFQDARLNGCYEEHNAKICGRGTWRNSRTGLVLYWRKLEGSWAISFSQELAAAHAGKPSGLATRADSHHFCNSAGWREICKGDGSERRPARIEVIVRCASMVPDPELVQADYMYDALKHSAEIWLSGFSRRSLNGHYRIRHGCDVQGQETYWQLDGSNFLYFQSKLKRWAVCEGACLKDAVGGSLPGWAFRDDQGHVAAPGRWMEYTEIASGQAYWRDAAVKISAVMPPADCLHLRIGGFDHSDINGTYMERLGKQVTGESTYWQDSAKYFLYWSSAMNAWVVCDAPKFDKVQSGSSLGWACCQQSGNWMEHGETGWEEKRSIVCVALGPRSDAALRAMAARGEAAAILAHSAGLVDPNKPPAPPKAPPEVMRKAIPEAMPEEPPATAYDYDAFVSLSTEPPASAPSYVAPTTESLASSSSANQFPRPSALSKRKAPVAATPPAPPGKRRVSFGSREPRDIRDEVSTEDADADEADLAPTEDAEGTPPTRKSTSLLDDDWEELAKPLHVRQFREDVLAAASHATQGDSKAIARLMRGIKNDKFLLRFGSPEVAPARIVDELADTFLDTDCHGVRKTIFYVFNEMCAFMITADRRKIFLQSAWRFLRATTDADLDFEEREWYTEKVWHDRRGEHILRAGEDSRGEKTWRNCMSKWTDAMKRGINLKQQYEQALEEERQHQQAELLQQQQRQWRQQQQLRQQPRQQQQQLQPEMVSTLPADTLPVYQPTLVPQEVEEDWDSQSKKRRTNQQQPLQPQQQQPQQQRQEEQRRRQEHLEGSRREQGPWIEEERRKAAQQPQRLSKAQELDPHQLQAQQKRLQEIVEQQQQELQKLRSLVNSNLAKQDQGNPAWLNAMDC